MRPFNRVVLPLLALILSAPLALLSGGGSAGPASAATAAAPTRPNVLLLVADDQAYSTFNRSLMPTVFSQLVDKGTLFDRQYVRTSMCCPSRSEMYTGLDERHNGVDANSRSLTRPTIAAALHAAGYRTAMTGKYLNSWPCGSRRAEFDLWVCQGNDGSSYSAINPRLNVNGTWQNYQGVAPEILADQVRDFVQSTPATQPFFVTYTPTSPHLPADDPRYANMPVPPYRPASYDENTTADGKPAYTRTPTLVGDRAALLTSQFTNMTRSVRGLDDSIATILNSLGSRADNTLVLYISDNGYLYGEHRVGQKEVPYEESVNTPFVVRYPTVGISPAVNHALVQNIDIAPTIAALAGLPWNADGASLLPLLSGASTKVRDAALIEYCEGPSYPCGTPQLHYNDQGGYDPPSFTGVVEPDWKYVDYATGEKELYNLAGDRAEMHNLAGDPAFADQQARLAAEEATLTQPADPVATIVTGPSGPQAVRSFTVSYFSRAANPSFLCRLTTNGVDAAWQACGTSSTNIGPLADGDYVFTVAAADSQGQPAPNSATRTFSIHTAGPPVTITKGPGSLTTGASVTFRYGSPTPGVRYECRLAVSAGTATWKSCPSTGVTYTNLANADWDFKVRAIDTTGRITVPPAAQLFRVNRLGPLTVFDTSPGSVTASATANFGFHFDEPTTGTATCTVDQQLPVVCTGQFQASNVTAGTHTLSVTATDVLGIQRVTKTTWTRDVTAPTVTVSQPKGTVARSPQVVSTASEPAKSFSCSIDGLPYFLCSQSTTLFGVRDGVHSLVMKAVDLAGNVSKPVLTTWTQDWPAVTTITDGPAAITASTSATFVTTASKPTAQECALDTAVYTPCPTGLSYTGLHDGDHLLNIRSSDTLGVKGPAVRWSWRVVTTAPTVALTSSPPAYDDTTDATIAFTTSEPGTTSCALDDTVPTVCTSPVTYSGMAPGPHAFHVTATNLAATSGPTATATWNVQTPGLAASIGGGPTNPTADGTAHFQLSVSDGSASLMCALDASPASPCSDAADFADLADGNHTLAVYAVDQNGNAGPVATTNWTVLSKAPQASVLEGPTATSYSIRASFTLTSDQSTSTLECALDAADYAPCDRSMTQSGLAAGAHTLSARAVSATEVVGPAVSWSWTTVLTSPTATIAVGWPTSTPSGLAIFRFSANQPGATFTCSLDSSGFADCKPPMVYDDLAPGSHTFSVRAANDAGMVGAAATAKWTVISS